MAAPCGPPHVILVYHTFSNVSSLARWERGSCKKYEPRTHPDESIQQGRQLISASGSGYAVHQTDNRRIWTIRSCWAKRFYTGAGCGSSSSDTLRLSPSSASYGHVDTTASVASWIRCKLQEVTYTYRIKSFSTSFFLCDFIHLKYLALSVKTNPTMAKNVILVKCFKIVVFNTISEGPARSRLTLRPPVP